MGDIKMSDTCELWRMRIHKDTFSIEKEEFEYRQADQQARHLVDETWWNVATLVPNEEVPRGMSHRRFYVYATLVGEKQRSNLTDDGLHDIDEGDIDWQLAICLFMLAKLMPSSSTLIML